MAYANGPRIVTDGLVCCLDAANRKSYAGSGTTWYDIAGQTVGSLTNMTFSTSNNGSFILNGSSSRMQSNSPDLALASGSNNSTVLIFCKPDSTGPSNQYTGLVSWGTRATNTPSTARVLSLYTSGTTMYVSSAFWGNDWTPNSLSVQANAWNLIGMVSRGSSTSNNVSHYRINAANGFGSQTGSSSNASRTLNTTNASLGIGVTDYVGRYFKGSIGAVYIYGRELSPTEIQQNYNALKGRYGL
jgi:hypothetical protein